MQQAKDILKRFWGYDDFRKKQDQIIEAVLQKKDTLALLPTGGGKSICYQVPGLMQEGVCLVISPLIALMQDQVLQLNSKGIKAVAINSSISHKEIDIQLDNAIYGNTKFLYISPERLKTRLFRARLEKMDINLIAVDEAHCISEWGYDFRPAYLNIAEIRTLKPNAPILALTATATVDVVQDIQEKLEFKELNTIKDSFTRPNISYNVNQSNNKLNRMLEFLKGRLDSGIVYCGTRKEVKNVCKQLIDNGLSANFYHGGLEYSVRKERQENWINNDTQIMVCTNAFGMGIDKPDVRFVVHYNSPDTIEAYFQEAGRAGRDGENAQTILFCEPHDLEDLLTKVEAKYPPLDNIKSIYQALGSHFQLAIGSGEGESYGINVLEFCDKFGFDLIAAYNSLKFLEISGYISLSENFKSSSKVKILIDNKALYQFQVKDEKTNKIVQFLLRTQMGIFDDLVSMNEEKIAQFTQLNLKDVKQILNFLSEQEAIAYIPQMSGTRITYITERLDTTNVSLPVELYHKRKEISLKKVKAMIAYLNSKECTHIFLLEYFGEINSKKCNKCYNCNSDAGSYTADIKKDINSYLNKIFNQRNTVEIQDLLTELNQYSKEEILEKIRWMIDHDLLIADEKGKTLIKN